MTSTVIVNIGALVSGAVRNALLPVESLLIADGTIQAFDPAPASAKEADVVVDAGGMTLAPGLFDSHVHPVFGGYSPRLRTIDWIESYLQGGITSMISTGELHLPGRPRDPQGVKALAILAAKSFRNEPPSGVKVQAGTLVLEPGLQERDFEEVARAGSRAVKFIRSISDRSEAIQMSKWAKQYGMKVIIHCGGTSLPDVPTTTAETILAIEPDVLAHLNGGPTALASEDIDLLIRETPWIIDVVRFGNLMAALKIVETVRELDVLERIVLGTDSPTGSGMEPLGMLHLMTTLASLSDLSPEEALCMATGNTADAYQLPQGKVEPGAPADLVLLDAPLGSAGSQALASMAIGDIPAVALVMIDGKIVVPLSRNTPPPQKSHKVVWKGIG